MSPTMKYSKVRLSSYEAQGAVWAESIPIFVDFAYNTEWCTS